MTMESDNVTDAQVHEFDGAGVALAMYNTEASIRGFATASFEYALDRQWCAH